MQKHNLQQGSPEWHDFRFNHDGASEAAAMLGLSKKTTRNELLHMKATGTAKEFSDYVQKNILDYGHEVEALARPHVENLLGQDLYPVTCSDGRLSASCDGLTLDDGTAFEHKQINKELAALVADGIVPDEHMPQCQQILMVTGAERVLFTVSDGTAANLVYTSVYPDPAWFERIRAGWAQFNKDLATYVPAEIQEMPKAEASIELPALFIQARGEITINNMEDYGNALAAKLVEVRAIPLLSDQDFANAGDAAKMFREQIKKLDMTKEAMLSQTVTIGEASRMIDLWKEDLRVTALQLEKDVTARKDAKKLSIISESKIAYAEHIAALENEIKPIRLNVQQPDFLLAMKGKSLVKAWQNAADTALANARIAADAQAKDYREKLAWCKEHASGHSALFPDLQQIITKPLDDFTLLINSRIDKHKAEEAEKAAALIAKIDAENAAKLEAEREAIRIQEEAKARAKVEAEQRAKLENEIKEEKETLKKYEKVENLGEPMPAVIQPVAPSKQSLQVPKNISKPSRPAHDELIQFVANNFNVSFDQARAWVIETAESLKVAA